MEDSVYHCGPSGRSGIKTNVWPVNFYRVDSDDPILKTLQQSPRQPSISQSLLSCFTSWKRKTHSDLKKIVVETRIEVSEEKVPSTPTASRFSSSKMAIHVDAAPYHWPHDGGLDPKSTALVIIDMQRDFCSPDGYLAYQGYDIESVREIIPNLEILLAAFRDNGFPIYHTREGHRSDLSTLSSREHLRSRNNPFHKGIGDKGPLGRLLIRGEMGHEIIPELFPRPNEQVIDKPGRSAFNHTEFRLMLNIKGVKNLVFCGVTTDVCVMSTMRDANDNNFDCILVEDACAASEVGLHTAAVETIKAEGGIFGAVSNTKKILASLDYLCAPPGLAIKPGGTVSQVTSSAFSSDLLDDGQE